jgi:hypothetical protein
MIATPYKQDQVRGGGRNWLIISSFLRDDQLRAAIKVDVIKWRFTGIDRESKRLVQSPGTKSEIKGIREMFILLCVSRAGMGVEAAAAAWAGHWAAVGPVSYRRRPFWLYCGQFAVWPLQCSKMALVEWPMGVTYYIRKTAEKKKRKATEIVKSAEIISIKVCGMSRRIMVDATINGVDDMTLV